MADAERFLVTGGAGFIGSAVVRHLIQRDRGRGAGGRQADLCRQSRLAGAGRRRCRAIASCGPTSASGRGMREADRRVPARRGRCIWPPKAMSTARSTARPPSSQTNVVGTYVLLEAALAYWRALPRRRGARFRFHHVSTDEVFGSLGARRHASPKTTPYEPSSPYSASKAASDHLVRAWHHTYGLPVVVTNCSNNYGPYQFPEKLIPLDDPQRRWRASRCRSMATARTCATGCTSRITRARCCADRSSAAGRARATMSAADAERSNIEVVRAICALLDELAPQRRRASANADHASSPTGRATTCATPSTPRKIARELGWRPQETFETRPAQDRALVSRQPRLVAAHPRQRLSRRAARCWSCVILVVRRRRASSAAS